MVQDSIAALHNRGYKVTRPRKQVLEILEQAQKPVSPYEIQRLLHQQGKYLNHVTIYRVLELLCHLNLAHRVLSSGGFVKCNLDNRDCCHRFVICRHCGAVQEFADEELCKGEGELARELGFHTEYHFSESSGLCADCYKRESGE